LGGWPRSARRRTSRLAASLGSMMDFPARCWLSLPPRLGWAAADGRTTGPAVRYCARSAPAARPARRIGLPDWAATDGWTDLLLLLGSAGPCGPAGQRRTDGLPDLLLLLRSAGARLGRPDDSDGQATRPAAATRLLCKQLDGSRLDVPPVSPPPPPPPLSLPPSLPRWPDELKAGCHRAGRTPDGLPGCLLLGGSSTAPL
jgi:hypothetical protein